MNRQLKNLRNLTAGLLLAMTTFTANAQSYSINWNKISGGGGASTGGVFSISGSLGQYDASGAMTGGSFTLTGGFWSLYAVQTLGAPSLAINCLAGQAVISWPAATSGWTLQTNSRLTSGSWGNYSGAIVSNSITRGPPNGNLFFRLKQN